MGLDGGKEELIGREEQGGTGRDMGDPVCTREKDRASRDTGDAPGTGRDRENVVGTREEGETGRDPTGTREQDRTGRDTGDKGGPSQDWRRQEKPSGDPAGPG